PMGKSRSPRLLRFIMWPPNLRLDEVGNEVRAALLPGGPGTLSGEGVRHGLLALLDEGDERLVDCRIERRRLIAIQPRAAQRIGALLDALFALDLPLLERTVVHQRRAVEGRLEMRLGVGAAETVASRPDLADGVERLSRFG